MESFGDRQQQSTKMRQRSAVAAAAPALVVVLVAVVAVAVAAAAAVLAATTAGVDPSCGRHGHSLIYSREDVCCSTGNQIGDIHRHFGYCWHLQIQFAPQIELFAAPIIGAANNLFASAKRKLVIL